MSLKAKLEAVIYAAEEPVTLAQLAVLFADEAMEWKAEQEAAARAAEEAQRAESSNGELPLDIEPSAESGALQDVESAPNTELEPSAELDSMPTTAEPQGAAAVEVVDASPLPGAEAETVAEDGEPEAAEPENAEVAAETAAELDPVAEGKRAARQRDREVRAILRQLLDEIVASYVSDGRGVEIREIAGGYRMATKPECHDAVRMFVKSLKPPLKLSLPALETLAVIAYKQPVTAPEVNEIRGVDSSGVFGSLLARKLIATAGRKQVIGRPILYKTTKEFLLRFGLKDVAELPSMEEFEKMAASELEDFDSARPGTNGAGPAAGAEPELDETAKEDEGGEESAAADEASESEQAAQSATEPAQESHEAKTESNSFQAAQTNAE